MEKSKYYTPDISEFYVGFEYERFIPRANATEEECWENIKMSINYLTLDEIDDEIIENEIRVKYLDQEDIESFGFTKDFIRTKSTTTLGYELNNKCCLFWKNYKSDNSSIVIHELINNGDCIFNGIIKNKSELKKLLQQLNII